MDYQLIFNIVVSAFMGVMAYKVKKIERDIQALKTVSVIVADMAGIIDALEEQADESKNIERGKENG